MKEEIINAITLLQDNGYIVKRWTRSMEKDANDCEKMAEQGKEKDCWDCACNICLIN